MPPHLPQSLMTVQYSSKAVVGVLLFLQGVRARLNLSTVGKTPSGVAPLLKLADLIGDARILYRIWGLLPMIQWLITIERTPPPTKLLLQIERIQAWSMVAYCPMEAIAYLGYHKVLNVSTDAQNWLWKHALRLWLLYIVLQFVHLVEDNRLLRLRAKALERSRGHPQPRVVKGSTEPSAPPSEDQQVTRRMWDEIRDRKSAIMTQFWIYIGYLPPSIHWAVPGGVMAESWVGFFGAIAAAAGMLPTWKATA